MPVPGILCMLPWLHAELILALLEMVLDLEPSYI